MPKVNRRDPEFLKWAKRQGGICCVCRALHGEYTRAEENHHFGQGGMGIRGVDHFVARLCRKHHSELQGKYRMWFIMNDDLETFTALVEDSLELLSDFRFETMEKHHGKVDDDVF